MIDTRRVSCNRDNAAMVATDRPVRRLDRVESQVRSRRQAHFFAGYFLAATATERKVSST